MIKIGCCGYPVNMRNYQETFKVIELNNTFYRYPKPQTVKKWKEDAPKDFEFTVKAHQDITHIYKMNLEQARESLEKMKEVCRLLDAKILLFQTPASFKPDKLKEVKSFFKQAERDSITLVWEPRGPLWETVETHEKLKTVLEELDVSHVTDPFRSMPVYTDKVAYLRLHGHGERMYYYQYSNEELVNLYEKTKFLDAGNRQVYVFFNNLTMFEDAQRFRSFAESGFFPRLTISGKEAVKIAVSRTRYPTTKAALIEKIGWKLVELEDRKQVKMADLLKQLLHNNYDNPDIVIKELNL
jgi:uncharacterized protein YecE (DUF72 family)